MNTIASTTLAAITLSAAATPLNAQEPEQQPQSPLSLGQVQCVRTALLKFDSDKIIPESVPKSKTHNFSTVTSSSTQIRHDIDVEITQKLLLQEPVTYTNVEVTMHSQDFYTGENARTSKTFNDISDIVVATTMPPPEDLSVTMRGDARAIINGIHANLMRCFPAQ